MLASDPLPEPPSVSPKPEPVIGPALVMLIVPELATMLLSLPSVISPRSLTAVAEEWAAPPPPETRAPLSDTASAAPRGTPYRPTPPPLKPPFPPAVVQGGFFLPPPAAPSASVPALIVV